MVEVDSVFRYGENEIEKERGSHIGRSMDMNIMIFVLTILTCGYKKIHTRYS